MPSPILLILIVCLLLCATACLPNSAADESAAEPLRRGFINTGESGAPQFINAEMSGVRVGLPVPPGWAADNIDGLIVAEHLSPMNGGAPAPGLLVYAFVPPLERFEVPAHDSANVAYHVLNQVVRMPTEIGSDVVATAPEAFTWGGHDAAYYLLNSADEIKTLVLAVETVANGRLLVINISAPGSQAERIRPLLPLLMDGVQINDVALDGEELDQLPAPLRFPTRDDSARLEGRLRSSVVDLPSPVPFPLTQRFVFSTPSRRSTFEMPTSQP
jgi:hypothetical protein